MKKEIENWIRDVLENEENIVGWAVCIVGVKRSAWLDENGRITREEKEACKHLTKDKASKQMNEWFYEDRDIWRYMRLVPVVDEKVFRRKLPLVSGY